MTTEALRMPACLHGLDHTTNDDVPALVAEWSIQDSEILLAVLATFKLVEDSVLKRAETLRASKMTEIIE